nr:terpene synthase [Boswellia serrata]
MAFASTNYSPALSPVRILPQKLSQTRKPHLIVVRSSSPTNQNQSTAVVSSPLLKQLKIPIGHPSSFADDFHGDEHARKLKASKYMLSKVGEDRFEGLAIVDAVQRLGIDYLFQDEIEEILRRQYVISKTHGFQLYDLQETALRFRLLRQGGYYVPADMFSSFTNKEGKIKQEVGEDINGLIGLYEASQLSLVGEDVLDEARDFSAELLNEWVKHLDGHQARTVRNTLSYPYHKSLSRFVAKNFFVNNFHGENRWIHVLQELAKMDFDLVQSLHKKEILQITEWWKDVGLSEKLECARDQPLKWYIWSMACLTDASLSWQRVELTKPISLIYIIDDIFDVYGTLDELTLFTEAISRWDLAATDQLPEYMRTCFMALDDITNEIGCRVYEKHGYNPVQSLRKAWASLCNAFIVEARWFSFGQSPMAEEYLKNGIVSSGVHVVLVHIFFLLGQGITRENVEHIDNNPAIISSTATILRLWDDLGSAKDENQLDGEDGSYIHYYMKEHQESSAEAAEKHAMDKISDAWKSLNKACLSSNALSADFNQASLNLARMVPLMYTYDDNQRLPILEEYIKSLLFENAPNEGLY